MAPSLWQLLIVLGIVLLVFGTKRLRGMGSDLGSAIRGFKDSMRSGEKEGKDDIAQLSTEEPDDTAKTQDAQQRSATTEKQSDRSGGA